MASTESQHEDDLVGMAIRSQPQPSLPRDLERRVLTRVRRRRLWSAAGSTLAAAALLVTGIVGWRALHVGPGDPVSEPPAETWAAQSEELRDELALAAISPVAELPLLSQQQSALLTELQRQLEKQQP